MKFIDLINNQLNVLSFSKDELTYLSLTGKIENTIRDKLAFSLHQNLKNNYFVFREWKVKDISDRTDIAILDKKNNIVCLIELKARAIPKIDNEFINYLKKDIIKMKNKSEVAEKVSIVIFNDLKVLGDNLDLLKYYKPNKLLNLDSLSKEIENSYLKIIEKTVLKPSSKIILDGGFFHNFQTENIIYTFIS